jgi:hypothetical protein
MARQGGRFPQRKPAPGTFEDNVARMQSSNRMASEAITDDDVIEALGETVLAELRGEVALDSAVQDAMDYIPQRKTELLAFLDENNVNNKAMADTLRNPSKHSLEDRLSVINRMEDKLNNLGRLKGTYTIPEGINKGARVGIPAPLVENFSKGRNNYQERRHTEYDIDPITGQTQVIPFMDPSNPTKGLVTTFGERRDLNPPSGPSAVELVELQALKLAGMPASLYGTGTAPHHYADFVSGDKRIEGMMVDRGKPHLNSGIAVPSYTSLVVEPDRLIYPEGFNPRGIKDLVEQEGKKLGTKDTIKATESLIDKGILGVDTEHRFGKLMRGDPSVMKDPEAVYDALVIAGMNKQAAGTGNFNKYAYPPDTLHYIPDLEATTKAVREGKIGRMWTTPNKGVSGDDYLRAKMQHVIPNTHATVENMAEVYPHTGQLLRNLPFIK